MQSFGIWSRTRDRDVGTCPPSPAREDVVGRVRVKVHVHCTSKPSAVRYCRSSRRVCDRGVPQPSTPLIAWRLGATVRLAAVRQGRPVAQHSTLSPRAQEGRTAPCTLASLQSIIGDRLSRSDDLGPRFLVWCDGEHRHRRCRGRCGSAVPRHTEGWKGGTRPSAPSLDGVQHPRHNH